MCRGSRRNEEMKVFENVKGAFQEGARSFRDPRQRSQGGTLDLAFCHLKWVTEARLLCPARALLCFTFYRGKDLKVFRGQGKGDVKMRDMSKEKGTLGGSGLRGKCRNKGLLGRIIVEEKRLSHALRWQVGAD